MATVEGQAHIDLAVDDDTPTEPRVVEGAAHGTLNISHLFPSAEAEAEEPGE